ncbi:dipeptidase [Thermoplasmatales archaeon AK]|nr:dipeptidase [Thermoplasmatales archaeon AK]
MVAENVEPEYRSFSYLEDGKDFKSFKLVSEIDRVKSRKVPLTEDEKARVEGIFKKYPAVSMHDHPFVLPSDLGETYEYIKRNRIFFGYRGLYHSRLSGVFDGLLNSFNLINSDRPWHWDSVVNELGMRLCDIDHQDFAIQCRRVGDITEAHKTGRLAVIPHLEGAGMIENDLDRIDILFGLGVRCIGLVYSEANYLGSGFKEKRDGGLTDFGHDAVERFNKVGMTIDLAHVGDLTSLEAIEASRKPCLITHAGCRSLWNTKRMKNDEVLKALAEKGGVLGIEAAPHTTISPDHPLHSLESVMDHFERAVGIIGIDHVGFGPDTMFGDHVGMHHLFSRELGIKAALSSVKYQEVEFVDGLENPSDFPNIVAWLVKNGYSDNEIGKVMGGNVIRVLKETWPR